ncbi:MAG: protein translocase subunit SecF [Acidobacteria bacterium]|nr:protein translocase subunit SecF [Acidobacteriota bacterium]
MIEIIKVPDIDWLGIKRWLILFSLLLLLAGAASVYTRGFNLGIDFAGGTLVNVRFRGTAPPEARLREELAKHAIDTGKIIIQPISDPLGGTKNQLLIRLPLEPAAQVAGSGETTPPASGTPAQAITPAGEELTAQKRAIVNALAGLNDPADVASKVDLNTATREAIRDGLLKADPLGLVQQAGQVSAEQQYTQYADRMVDHRDRTRNGLLDSPADLKSVPEIPATLVDAMPAHFFAGNAAMINAEIVGPQIGEELTQRAIYVSLASFIGMLIYIAFRFEWVYGVAGVIALFHDLLITFGIFSILQKEISLTVVAAFLTLVGYSMNDKIVIFDRIRENLKLRRRDDLTKLVNDSINQTLSRTILTGGMTLIALLSLWLFGGPVLEGFALALWFGIIIGTYSSVAIASPIMVWWQLLRKARSVGHTSRTDTRRSPEARRDKATASR